MDRPDARLGFRSKGEVHVSPGDQPRYLGGELRILRRERDDDVARRAAVLDLQAVAELCENAFLGRDVGGIALQPGADKQAVQKRRRCGIIELGQLCRIGFFELTDDILQQIGRREDADLRADGFFVEQTATRSISGWLYRRHLGDRDGGLCAVVRSGQRSENVGGACNGHRDNDDCAPVPEKARKQPCQFNMGIA